MNTITAKELRDNLDQIVKRVRLGEPIRVTYRSKAAFTLQPEKPSHSLLPGSAQAMKKFSEETRKLRNSKKRSVFDPNKNTKELYHELLDNDSKYKPPYHR
ncbi:MAG TPA: type II toxin-antitoxin system prevent-host-death family antitoxin [Candidatus Saccharimonadales bacterium]|jgi:prevent-host-death family protein|nr:type II toxin-antitoxin system prevent-host-death family antitoxin [Candidatus Saccharimonadales bacterium]